MRRRESGNRFASVLRYGLLVCTGVLFALPLYWMLTTSMSRPDAAVSSTPPAWPTVPLANYVRTLSSQDWPGYFANTFFVAACITILSTVTSAAAGYALANLRMPGKKTMFVVVVAAFVVPSELTFVPNFAIMKELGWLNTYWALIIPFVANPLGIFIMRQSFLGLPREIWETAVLDGCSHLRFLRSVAVPCSRAALITTALIGFITAWNLFEWPLIFTTDENLRTVQVALSYYNNAEAGASPTVLAAAGVLVTLPVFIVYLLVRRHITAGLTGEAARSRYSDIVP